VGPRAGLNNMESRKILSLLGLKHQPLSCLAHRYTDCTILAPGFWLYDRRTVHKIRKSTKSYSEHNEKASVMLKPVADTFIAVV
jgi:hypothetical protein